MDTAAATAGETADYRSDSWPEATPGITIQAADNAVDHPILARIAGSDGIADIQGCCCGFCQFRKSQDHQRRTDDCFCPLGKRLPKQGLPPLIRAPHHGDRTGHLNRPQKDGTQVCFPTGREADQHLAALAQEQTQMGRNILRGRFQRFRRGNHRGDSLICRMLHGRHLPK